MDEKNNQSIDELIAFLDGRMSNGGGAVKPKFENGKMVEAEDIKDKLFTDGLDADCPTCANIPNMMAFRPDNERDLEEERYVTREELEDADDGRLF